MLRKWNPPTPLSLWADSDASNMPPHGMITLVTTSKSLSKQQQRELSDFLAKFSDVLSDLPGKTDSTGLL